MKILIQGTSKFDSYEIFMNAIGRAIRTMAEDDTELTVYSLGPARVTSMAHEFINVSSRTLKANGLKPRVFPANKTWVKANLDVVDEFIFLCKPKENLSEIASLVDRKGSPDLLVYAY